jgi:ferredoxin
VDAQKCTACGNCVAACPRDLIELHPVDYEAFVFCKSQDPGPIAKKVCKKACIACGICVKAAGKDENPEAVQMKGNLAVVNTENYTAKPEYGDKCPTDSYTTRANIERYERFVNAPVTAGAAAPAAGADGGGTAEGDGGEGAPVS